MWLPRAVYLSLHFPCAKPLSVGLSRSPILFTEFHYRLLNRNNDGCRRFGLYTNISLTALNLYSSPFESRTSTITHPNSSCPIIKRTTSTKTSRSGRQYWKWKLWTPIRGRTPKSSTTWATIISRWTLRESWTTINNWTPTIITRTMNSCWPPKTKVRNA